MDWPTVLGFIRKLLKCQSNSQRSQITSVGSLTVLAEFSPFFLQVRFLTDWDNFPARDGKDSQRITAGGAKLIHYTAVS